MALRSLLPEADESQVFARPRPVNIPLPACENGSKTVGLRVLLAKKLAGELPQLH
jgi:hypothetical protein